MGNPAWMIGKYAMLWPCCSLFSFKALLYFRHLCYFSEIISYRFYFISQRFYFLSGRFIIALLFSVRELYHSAFIQFFLSARKCFIITLLFSFSKCKKALYHSAFIQFFLKCKQVLIFYSECKSALIFYSSKYETVSNFIFKNIIQLLL